MEKERVEGDEAPAATAENSDNSGFRRGVALHPAFLRNTDTQLANAKSDVNTGRLNEKRRMFWMLLILWLLIGWLDLQGLQFGRSSPVSVLYVLVILPAAVVFGRPGLAIATTAVIVMYHFTNDKRGIWSYSEPELLRLGFVVLVGAAMERISRDRAEIRSALEKLQRETKVREDLTHMLVHDLRTPLTGVLTSLQTLQMGTLGDLDEDQKEMVDFAVSDSQRLLEMVNQILDVAKLEAGEMQLRLERVPMSDLAESACRVIKPLADESGINLTYDCNGLEAQVDTELMRRVLVNLLGNAVKFTPRDGSVRVMAMSSDEEGMAHIVVSDTGYGIPEQDLPRIFDKYAQVKGGKKVKGPSSGIGLTFCRLAVDAHGGRIWAESQMGEGTQMHIVIPQDGPPSSGDSASRN